MKLQKLIVYITTITMLLLSISCQATENVKEPNVIGTSPNSEDETIVVQKAETPIVEMVQSDPTQNIVPEKESAPWVPVFGIESGDSFDLVSQGGIHWIRIDPQLKWSEVETQKGVYVWNKSLESSIIDANLKGLKVILTIQNSPEWARKYPDRACGPIREDAFPAFAVFLKAVVQRYSVEPYNVNFYLIWNEPDAGFSDVEYNGNSVFGCWGEESYPNDPYYGGEYFGKMLMAAYPSMKEVNPRVTISIGGLLLACDPRKDAVGYCGNSALAKKWNFFEGVVKETGGNSFDMVAFHGYTYHKEGINPVYRERMARGLWSAKGGVVDGKIDYLREIMNKYGIIKPIIITESALIISPKDVKPQDFEDAKADYLVWTYANTWSQGINATIWYSLHGWRYSELLDANGNPLSAYNALKTMSTILNNAEFISREDKVGFTQFNFWLDNQTILLLVPTGKVYGTTYNIAKPPNFVVAKESILGDEISAPGDTISFSRPIYIIVNHD